MRRLSPSLCLLIFLISLFYSVRPSSSSSLPDRFLKLVPNSLGEKYFEVTLPLPTDRLKPSCSLLVLRQDFGDTIGDPPATADYSPPSHCLGPWSHVVLELNASCKGEQYDRVAGVWLDGVEILRTSTAEPTESGIFWTVRKDVTRYTSLLAKSNIKLAMMLENIVNDELTGVYHVSVSFLYYKGKKKSRVSDGVADGKVNRNFGVLAEKTVDKSEIEGDLVLKGEDFAVSSVDEFEENVGVQSEEFGRKLGFISRKPSGGLKVGENTGYFDDKPADLIIPISDDGDTGYWFRIQNESNVRSKEIEIPRNTYRAVLEIYVSFHGNDEFWYSNPPDDYIAMNNLTTKRGNGAFRQVVATIDDLFVGSAEPFPVIFTGGINPLFWEPIVAIGAFDLPSYDLDLTPFLEFLLDGNSHFFGLRVTNSISFWLIDANLHLWLDPHSSVVTAKSVLYRTSSLSLDRNYNFDGLDGKFKIEAERETEFSGWVVSSAGNFTTRVSYEFEFKNSIKFKSDGKSKEVEQKIKSETDVRVVNGTGFLVIRAKLKKKFPFNIKILTLPGPENNTYMSVTNVSHSPYVKTSLNSPNSKFTASVSNKQVCGGWMVVQDHSVLIGTASTNQTLSYNGEMGCYSRDVAAKDGKLLQDNWTTCNPLALESF